jgi:hypothetical protein
VTSEPFSFRAELWEQDGAGSWHFVSLPADLADQIEEAFGRHAGGFGSVRVEVTVGATTWRTSIFPDGKRKTYVLPVKKPVRVAEGLKAGSAAQIWLRVLS